MKKLFIITITVCMLFLVTACSTKNNNQGGNGLPVNNTEKKEDKPVIPTVDRKILECNKDFSSQMSSGIHMEQDVYLEFVDNKIEIFDLKMSFELPSSYRSNAETFLNTMKKTYDDQYGIYDGVKVTLNRESDLEFDIIIAMDFKKISASDKISLGMSGSEDYSVNRSSFIREGYTCE